MDISSFVKLSYEPYYDCREHSNSSFCLDTNIVLLHHFDALPADLKSNIPRSTLSNWAKMDVSKIMGCKTITENDVDVLKGIARNKKLLLAAKALYVLFTVVTKLLQHVENKAEVLRANRALILETIEKVKPVLGLKRVLRSIGLSASKMYYWLEKKKCQNSVFQLCQSRHPGQLLHTEVNNIKQ